jgi:hypothetical protein
VLSETNLEDMEVFSTTAPARILADLPAIQAEGRIPLEVLYSFVSLRGKTRGGRVIAFTSARQEEGVTYVVQQLGRQLAAYCSQDVLIMTPPDLRRLRVLDAEQIELVGQRAAPSLWTLPSDLPEPEENGSAGAREDLWKKLRARFRYVLFDCSALECSGEVLSLAPRIDGTVLVVRAGFTAKPDIQKAARLLSVGSSPFLGCILNARTYPIPGFLHRLL